MKMFNINPLLQGVLFLVGLGLAAACEEYQILQCINNFKSSVGTEGAKTEQQMTDLCDSYYPDLRRCLSTYTAGCGLQMRSIFEGITKLYDYMCNEGKEDAIKYGECLSKKSLVSDIKGCTDTVKSKIQTQLFADKKTKCGFIDDFMDCTTDATRTECGPGAATYENKMVRLEMGSLLESIDCETDAGNTVTNIAHVTIPMKIGGAHPKLTAQAFEKNTQSPNPSSDRNVQHPTPIYQSGKHSGCASISAMLWVVGAALIIQWFVR